VTPAGGAVIRAAGGLLWRRAGDGIEIALVHRPRYDDWSMPKGKLARGEDPVHAALREVTEETGVRAVLGRRLPTQEYTLGPDRKTVDYWAMTTPPDADFVANDEVDVLRWVPPAEAGTFLSYDRDRDLLRAFLAVPPPTGMVLLVRHARAGKKADWSGDDDLRPLDAVGRRQAQALRVGLRWFAPEHVHSADPVRCVDTVAPLAADLGVVVQRESALTEESYGKDPARATDRLLELAAAGGRVVVCSQGGVIPGVLGEIADASGLRIRRRDGRPPARKGGVWALSFVDGRLTAADYYHSLAPGPDVTGPPEPVA
jgi:8-oxo-(d)GTP phosphatase